MTKQASFIYSRIFLEIWQIKIFIDKFGKIGKVKLRKSIALSKFN